MELGPKNFAKLVKNRPNELATVHAAVCDRPRTVHYVEDWATGGVWEFAAPSFRDFWWKGKSIDDALPIPCLPLQDILDTHLGKEKLYFDFFSLDVEGAELEVLQSLDYERVAFGVILCEADGTNELKNIALRTFLFEKGYIFLYNRDRSWWFVNIQFSHIYSALLHAPAYEKETNVTAVQARHKHQRVRRRKRERYEGAREATARSRQRYYGR